VHDRAYQLAATLAALSEPERRRRRVQALVRDRTLQALVADLVAARTDAGMSQADVAARMFTTTSAVSRLESGRFTRPTLTTIEKYARAVGARVEIRVRR
jgi:ribosome-binding protein aMBF1 (putative translation factor)